MWGMSPLSLKRIPMPTNILFIIDSLHLGGTEKQLIQLIRHLDPERFRPHVCTLKEAGRLSAGLDVPTVSLDFRSFSHPSLIAQVVELGKYIRRHRIQVIQTFFQDPFLLAALSRPFNGAKLIGSFRDLGFWRTSAETRKMRLAYPFFAGFIANSVAVRQHFSATDGLAPEKIQVIYNGIDPVPLVRSSRCLGQSPLIGIVANCNRPVKRVDDFIHAAALVHRQRPDARFEIVGDGHLRPALEALAWSQGLQGVLTFTGSVAEPLERVANFHVGVITSESEGFCNAILEYMACGVAVVATAAGGNPELVRDGENGFLVPVGGIELLAERLLTLISSPDLLQRFEQKNYAQVLSQFSLKKMVDQHQSYYASFLP